VVDHKACTVLACAGLMALGAFGFGMATAGPTAAGTLDAASATDPYPIVIDLPLANGSVAHEKQVTRLAVTFEPEAPIDVELAGNANETRISANDVAMVLTATHEAVGRLESPGAEPVDLRLSRITVNRGGRLTADASVVEALPSSLFSNVTTQRELSRTLSGGQLRLAPLRAGSLSSSDEASYPVDWHIDTAVGAYVPKTKLEIHNDYTYCVKNPTNGTYTYGSRGKLDEDVGKAFDVKTDFFDCLFEIAKANFTLTITEPEGDYPIKGQKVFVRVTQKGPHIFLASCQDSGLVECEGFLGVGYVVITLDAKSA
jgi:hypothetical protein